MKDFEKYYDFIRDEETRNSVKRLSDKIKFVCKNFSPAITEFINPYVAELCMPLINYNGIKFELFPSYEHGERKVFVLYPDFYVDIDKDDYVSGLRIKNKSRFKLLSHKDYLGALMSLGIDRNKTGDIYVYEDYADIVIHRDISDYVFSNMDKIGSNKIEAEQIGIDEVRYKEQEYVFLNINTSSMRLDNIVKHVTNKSREDAALIVKSGAVKINWQPEDKVSADVKEGDMLSIKRYGRFKIIKNEGVTKSGKHRLKIKHYV